VANNDHVGRDRGGLTASESRRSLPTVQLYLTGPRPHQNDPPSGHPHPDYGSNNARMAFCPSPPDQRRSPRASGERTRVKGSTSFAAPYLSEQIFRFDDKRE